MTTETSYVAFMETNDTECESWYYFLRYQGNEENLQHLQKQLEQVDWYIIDDLSTFDLDLDHFVSPKTAKEMSKIDLNAYSFHRKFDGKLKHIDLDLKTSDNNEEKICKVFDKLGYGQIEDYVSEEDIDEEDLTDVSCSETESDTETESDDEEEEPESEQNPTQVPLSIRKTNLPRFIRAKRRKNRKPLTKSN